MKVISVGVDFKAATTVQPWHSKPAVPNASARLPKSQPLVNERLLAGFQPSRGNTTTPSYINPSHAKSVLYRTLFPKTSILPDNYPIIPSKDFSTFPSILRNSLPESVIHKNAQPHSISTLRSGFGPKN